MRRALCGVVMTIGVIGTGPASIAADGVALYATLCEGCHGHGAEALGPYPGLFGNATVRNGGALYVAYKGLRGAGNMFPLCANATDEELAGIANYVASSNGSPAAPVSAQDVAGLRPAPADCPPVRR
jgi:mono/diheme cytochrome c family protein